MKIRPTRIEAKDKNGRLLEVIIYPDKILVFERIGHGQIMELTKTLSSYIDLKEKFNSWCG